MHPPSRPADETERLQELHSYGVLDTQADPKFDDISELTRRIAGTEIGIISLVDHDRQWFKSCVGAPLGQQQTSRDISFCGHTILQREPLIIQDAAADPRFADNPLVIGEPFLRFYAGFPLVTPNGFVVGSLCAMSCEPHRLHDQQIDSLRRLASLTMHQLEVLRASALQASRDKGLEVQQLRSMLSERLSSLDRLISRDQMVQMLDLMFGMELESPFTLMRCCFRDYERVNSSHGGIMAEDYMNEAARRVLASIPRSASVARFSDAELVVLLPFTVEESEVGKIAERILAFASHLYRSGQHSLSMALSVGIAMQRQNYDSPEAILADTSMAVRMARRLNGNTYRFIDSDSRSAARESYRLESELCEAIAGKQPEPYLQPIVDLRSGEPVGFEALARWSRAEDLMKPEVFIPLATECGITGELDLLIIEKALAAMPLLAQPVPGRAMRLSFNISGILLEDRALCTRLLELIDDNPCPPGWCLQAELLEDVFQDFSSEFSQFLAALVSRKVRIAIDDFGTGYSSLARLISLPIQAVKVDRLFITRLGDGNESPRTLLRTMLTMLADLDLEITAEGVETEQQRQWLLRHGAGTAQGFLFSAPLSISEAITLLRKLDYRPRAIPVDRRRRLHHFLWMPFLGGRRNSD